MPSPVKTMDRNASHWRHAYFLIHPEIRKEMRRRKVEDEHATMRQIIHNALCRELGRDDLLDVEPPDDPGDQ